MFKVLKENNIRNVNGEVYEAELDEIKNAILSVKKRKNLSNKIINNFSMRPEQLEAVELTSNYFKDFDGGSSNEKPHFLWNCKMRFGKTFATYQLAKTMNWKNIMVLTWKPAVESEWKNELLNHADFEGWQFLSRNSSLEDIDFRKPLCWFASFQDILGKNKEGKVKERFEKAYKIKWDCIILDEYHFGAWREDSKELYIEEPNEAPKEFGFEREKFPLKSNGFLYLTGTPFRALNNGEFLEDQIFTWSYPDEQRAKDNWNSQLENPYKALPKMVMLTYDLPDEIKQVATEGDFDEFSLNEFFKAYEEDGNYEFVHKSDVQKWLDYIRGNYIFQNISASSNVKLPPLPYKDTDLLGHMNHSIWFLPSIASCYAMENLLAENQNLYFLNNFSVINVSKKGIGSGLKALPPVRNEIGNGFDKKTITLSCEKLTTGVTVPEWCSVFMLKNLNSPESYFQSVFRVQSPWVVNENNERHILKHKCYIFDFAPQRALRLVESYSSRISLNDTESLEDKVSEFLKFLPILQYDGFQMTPIDARELLDFANSGIGATMLARKWQSELLVKLDNENLEKLLQDKDLINAIENLEAFKKFSKDVGLNQQIEIVVNSEKAISKLEKELQPKSKEVTEEEKKNKSFKKEFKDAMKKLLARVPVFMYLTDYREERLKDVIEQLETDLFTKVTNISLKQFEKLCDIGIFPDALLNSAVSSFRRFEEASLNYVGGGYEQKQIGLWNTTVKNPIENKE